MQVIEFKGIVVSSEVKSGKKSDFSIINVSGMDIPFFGDSRKIAEDFQAGDKVRALFAVSEKNGYPNIQGLAVCIDE